MHRLRRLRLRWDARGSAQTPETGEREFYQIRRYQLQTGPQVKLTSDYFGALIPALNRLGMKPVGALQLKFGPETPANYLVIPGRSVEALATIDRRLAKDEEFVKRAEAFWNSPDGCACVYAGGELAAVGICRDGRG